MIETPSLLLSKGDVAQLIGRGRRTVDRRVQDGSLPAPRNFGGSPVWMRDEIEDAIRGLPIKGEVARGK